MKYMAFNNPQFPEPGELMCTVRRVVKKWLGLEIGELLGVGGSKRGARIREVGVVERIVICRFEDLTYDDLKNEHDPKCRDKGHLLHVLNRAYGRFSIADPVVVICIRMRDW